VAKDKRDKGRGGRDPRADGRKKGTKDRPPLETAIATPPPEEDPLTVQERLFVNEFLVHRNGLRAYRKVYGGTSYGAMGVAACNLLKKDKVKAEIQAYVKAQCERTKITADRVLKEIGRIAFVDPEELQDDEGNIRKLRDVPVEVRKAIAGVDVSRVRTYTDKETGVTTEESVLRYKLWDKNAALGKLMKHLGLETEITPLEALMAMLPEDVRAEVREAMARKGSKETK